MGLSCSSPLSLPSDFEAKMALGRPLLPFLPLFPQSLEWVGGDTVTQRNGVRKQQEQLSLSLSLAAILFAFRRVNHFRDIVSPSLTPFAGKIDIQFTFVGLFHVQSSAKWY